MTGANLSGASLIGAQLNSTDLEGATLVGSLLVGARLTGADVRQANLGSARILVAELTENDLEIDPILLELNELEREQILVDAELAGLRFDDNTIWPTPDYVPAP